MDQIMKSRLQLKSGKKTKTCQICREKYTPRYSSLQKTCNKPGCMAAHARLVRLKKVRTENRAYKQKHKIETVPYQHDLTKPVFNRMRVLEEKLWFSERDIEPYCISCGKVGMDWCCGHLKTVGSQGNLRYDRRNTYLQCNWRCNKNLSGNIAGNKTTHGYKRGLIMRFGQVEGQSIIDYCEQATQNVKWDWAELKQFRKQCNQKIRQLKFQISGVA